MKAFVTGSAGFIGSKLSVALINQGFEVCGYDNFHKQVHGDDPDKNFPYNIVDGDIRDLDRLSDAIGKFAPDIIYHLAAETGTGQSFDEPARYVEVNVTGTANLFEACRLAGIKPKKVILASSRAVYGEGLYVNSSGEAVEACTRESAKMAQGDFAVYDQFGKQLIPQPTPESLQPKPDSVYASTKLMQEFLVKNLAIDFDWSILRFQNVYGPGQSLRNPYTGVLSIFCSQIKAGKTLEVYEDGDIFRDFIFVNDVVSSLIAAVHHASREITNIGSGQAISMKDVVTLLLELADAKGYSSNFQITGKFREGDIRFAQADILKAQELLEWQPQFSLANGLSELVNWSL